MWGSVMITSKSDRPNLGPRPPPQSGGRALSSALGGCGRPTRRRLRAFRRISRDRRPRLRSFEATGRRSRPRLEALRMSGLHLEPAEVAGETCVRVTGAPLEPVILCGAGPRIVGLERDGSNLFAVCPDAVLESDGMEPLRLHGGHRLWVAPEVPEVTYRPDVGQVELSVHRLPLSIRGAGDGTTGLQREIRMRLSASREQIEVDHLVANHGR